MSREVGEALALVATLVGRVAWSLLFGSAFGFVVPVVAGWLVYVLVTVRRHPEVRERWGLRREGLAETCVVTGVLGAVAGGSMLAYGVWSGAPFPWTMGVVAVVYPLWGLVQQLLLLGIVVGVLERVFRRPWVITLVTATLFAGVHLAHPPVMVATFGLALAITPIWLRWRNLWPLALAHGWLGTLLYYAVLHRDPLEDILRTLLG